MTARMRRPERVFMKSAEAMSQQDDFHQRIRALEALPPGVAIHEIKVFEDTVPVVVGDDKFIWEVPEDLDGATLVKVAGFISAAGTGDTEVAIRLSAPCEAGADILTEKIVIDDGLCGSFESLTQPEVTADTLVTWGQHLHIDVDAAGDGALGLGVHIIYAPADIASVVLSGAQGPPGGVTEWTGEFDAGDTYVVNQSVSYGGTSYVAITNVTAGIIPGVTPGWEDFWQILVQGHEPYSGIVTMILGNNFQLDVGVKAAIPVPFDCEIVEAWLLADAAGDVVVDLWLDGYGSYPPTDADSITAAAPLTLVAANKTNDTTLTGWTTTLTTGQVLMVVIESVSDLTWLSVGLRVQRP